MIPSGRFVVRSRECHASSPTAGDGMDELCSADFAEDVTPRALWWAGRNAGLAPRAGRSSSGPSIRLPDVQSNNNLKVFEIECVEAGSSIEGRGCDQTIRDAEAGTQSLCQQQVVADANSDASGQAISNVPRNIWTRLRSSRPRHPITSSIAAAAGTAKESIASWSSQALAGSVPRRQSTSTPVSTRFIRRAASNPHAEVSARTPCCL